MEKIVVLTINYVLALNSFKGKNEINFLEVFFRIPKVKNTPPLNCTIFRNPPLCFCEWYRTYVSKCEYKIEGKKVFTYLSKIEINPIGFENKSLTHGNLLFSANPLAATL